MRENNTAIPWSMLQWYVDNDGRISIGRIGPIACAAVASDEDQMQVALVRRDDETFIDLLTRLDAALLDTIENETYVDEINGLASRR